MSLLGLLSAAGSATPPGPLTDLPDLIPGGERLAPYTLPRPSGYSAVGAAITPTYDGSGQTVHPSVVDMVHETGEPFRGFRFWMAITPYADSNDQLENPCILVSNHGWEWQEPQGINNPLDQPVGGPAGSPDGGYNSDTELAWDPEGERFILYWRRAFEKLHAAESVDGIHWTYHWNRLSAGSVELISPSIARRGPSDWWLFAGGAVVRVYRSASPLGPWDLQGAIQVPTPSGTQNLWHYSVHWDQPTGHFFMSATSRDWAIYPAVSLDGINWTSGPNLVGGPWSYRSTMTPADDPAWFNVWDRSGQWTIQYTQLPRSLWTDLLP